MTLSRLLLPLGFALLALLGGGCDRGPSPEPAPSEPTTETGQEEEPASELSPEEPASDPSPEHPDAVVALEGPDGEELDFAVELAADPPSRQRGLMEREELAEGTGMLFLFPDDSEGGFWMRNTLIPLDIAYIAADGQVVEVLTMVPCTEDPCEVYTPSSPYRYALEVNAGELTESGVDDRWVADLPDDLPTAE